MSQFVMLLSIAFSCLCMALASTDLQGAIDACSGDCMISLISSEVIQLNSELQFTVPIGHLTIEGNGASIRNAQTTLSFLRLASTDVSGLTLRNMTLTKYEAAYGDAGGAIRVSGLDFIELDLVTFISNTAKVGGAVSIDYTQTISITRCEFTQNTALFQGGALHFGAGNGLVSLADNHFQYNSGGYYGGAVTAESIQGSFVRNYFGYNQCQLVGVQSISVPQ
jgi:predicted outer membrane repeat protein